jgi:hypothetical protein
LILLCQGRLFYGKFPWRRLNDYPSHIVQLEYKPEEWITFVAIADDLLNQLEKLSKKRGVSIETLVNLLIQEKLSV